MDFANSLKNYMLLLSIYESLCYLVDTCLHNHQLFAQQGVVFKGSKRCMPLEISSVAVWRQECN